MELTEMVAGLMLQMRGTHDLFAALAREVSDLTNAMVAHEAVIRSLLTTFRDDARLTEALRMAEAQWDAETNASGLSDERIASFKAALRHLISASDGQASG